MNNIFYSLAGEGLGHCIRAYSLMQKMPEYNFHVFTWGEAYDFFESLNYKNLHKITPIHFGRNKNNHISFVKTSINLIKLILSFNKNSKYILNLKKLHNPKLFIVDFEPLLAWTAYLNNIKYITIDNQHRFSCCETPDIGKFRIHSFLLGALVNVWNPFPYNSIISTFNHEKIKKNKNVNLVNIFIRNELEKCEISNKEFVLLYYKKSMNDNILKILNSLNIKVKIYGYDGDKKYNFEYHNVDNNNFIKDLSECSHVISGSGNQLLGECIYFGKPVLVIPEPNQFEQYINGYFLEKMNYGKCVFNENLTTFIVQEFLQSFTPKTSKRINGTYEAILKVKEIINEIKTKC